MKKKSRLSCMLRDLLNIYLKYRVSRSAAELAYFLMLSIFPLIICLYALLGRIVPNAYALLVYLEEIFPAETVDILQDFMVYVASHQSTSMFVTGVVVLITSASGAFRSVHNIMADIQGNPRYAGAWFLLVSFLMSIIFLLIVYFAVIVIITGEWFLNFLDAKISFLNISWTWNWIRFLLLFAMLLLLLAGIYRLTARKRHQIILPGAIIASACLVAVSILFSIFISYSVRYSLVYGSMASVIILMFWLYLCGNVLIMGNALNLVLAKYLKAD